MADETTAAAQPAQPSLKDELLAMLKAELLPVIRDAAQVAVAAAAGSGNPIVAVAAPVVLDTVDTIVNALSGRAAPAGATDAPTDVESRLTALENHVAALTIATGHATSAAFAAVKQATAS